MEKIPIRRGMMEAWCLKEIANRYGVTANQDVTVMRYLQIRRDEAQFGIDQIIAAQKSGIVPCEY